MQFQNEVSLSSVYEIGNVYMFLLSCTVAGFGRKWKTVASKEENEEPYQQPVCGEHQVLALKNVQMD